MDNTLLPSRIDFYAWKHEIYEYLIAQQILTGELSVEDQTSSTIIELAKQAGIRMNSLNIP